MRDVLLEKIELLRQRMVYMGLEFGLDHPDVLEYSIQIDQLHNELNQIDHSLSKAGNRKKAYRFYLMENNAHFA
ncbi:Spo0E family sporulation regulatory protein-aspartic acid phosphatase [Brevibacillus porteri]|uniref:Aspartyl-phosphate phosphatase Spo0E family protein n=1 Tax=Brevibacillus brevis TaxID=1393 RepID=A0A517IGF7_BREBE|nr:MULTISPECIES: aspartyl-phosphate phosphatase Spo0E family protein [Brevibacillus]ATF15334.1 aspartyl-phosphate phosphatase Spo0E family protein [Brevibacillus brevis X23]MED1915590.1 aspartyl-phosphate phosphatase Spo0E family protein [Bacillus thuringiensis]MBY0086217.1 aspartyl-phosphate phosphatase Spo0E family protein [Brevibacillus brevis]MCC8438088.1 aspartyl-phosphate phosphatase Spo0E family protein [Brevibacillus sp. M2.1A]MCE0450199.1 aspartyl-phosphate phosphatase Spo0E family pr